MVFLVRSECPCCRANLWHCKGCWDNFHNGKRDNDWIPPKHPGQPLVDTVKLTEEFIRRRKEHGVQIPD